MTNSTNVDVLATNFLTAVSEAALNGGLVKAFDEADKAASGDSGYQLNMDAAKAFAFPVEALVSYDPTDKENPWVNVVNSAQDKARPDGGPTFRKLLADLALRAVNASGEDEATEARSLNGKVPSRKLPDGVTQQHVEKELRAECDRNINNGSNATEEVKDLYRLILNGIDDVDGLVAIGKRINAETVASTRWIGRAVYLPILEPLFDEYTGATKGYATKKVGSVWQETCRKAASAHKGAFKNGEEKVVPTLADIQAAIEAAARTELGLDNLHAVIHGKEKASEEERKASALKAIYSNLRTLDELTDGAHNLYASCAPLLKVAGSDKVGDERAAKEADKAAKKAAEEAAVKEERAKRLAEKKAAKGKATSTAAATGVDVTRAQAEVDAADKAATKATAKKGPVAKAKPDVAALDALSAQVSGKPASAKPVRK